MVRPDKVTNTFPHAPEQAPAASLVCIGFKGGAEVDVMSFIDPKPLLHHVWMRQSRRRPPALFASASRTGAEVNAISLPG